MTYFWPAHIFSLIRHATSPATHPATYFELASHKLNLQTQCSSNLKVYYAEC